MKKRLLATLLSLAADPVADADNGFCAGAGGNRYERRYPEL